ncbi:hypothetical protein SAMN05216593_11529 [Pseudomonas asturiensis]|uniref:Uncharacterized protein n=1 Tax=Pseudomonas asturiensis TaxID=1190415 RepID=A0A1M7PXS5_9PSED|nr:hypothetical protein [Pseudomonas asturiensis]SHN22573.1 hypothetical protein SAMN05216593_11529 [Pseudomonas asturiensis]
MAKYEVRLKAEDFKVKKYPEIVAELYENDEFLSSILLSLDTEPEDEIDFDGDLEMAKHVLVDLAFSFREKISKLSDP